MKKIKLEDVQIDELIQELQSGKVIVYPTETCYGLGCDAQNVCAVQRIFDIKQRQEDKPLLVIMADKNMAMRYVYWTDELDDIANRYWPGPLTAVTSVLPDHELAPGVIGPKDTLAFRITSHPFASELTKALGKPIVSTSANVSSLASPYDIETILEMFSGMEFQPDIVIDAGSLPEASPSTVVRFDGQRLQVVRQGEIVIHHT